MPTNLVPALLSARRPDYRTFGGRLAIIAGVGGLLMGLVRVATSS
jgi:hypothetical protein